MRIKPVYIGKVLRSVMWSLLACVRPLNKLEKKKALLCTKSSAGCTGTGELIQIGPGGGSNRGLLESDPLSGYPNDDGGR